LLATGTVFATVYLQITIAMPLTLTARGQPAAHLGLLLTVSAITMVLGQPLLRLRVLSRLDHFSAMTTGYLVLSGGMLATGFARTLSEFTAATVLWSLGDLVLLGRAYTIVAGIAPSNARGRYLAVYGISWGIASIAAPLVGTQLLQHRGPEAIWITCAAACLVLSTIQPVMRARLQQHK
jgi:MFS family permease